ncbi:hypothetical protein ACIO9J_44385, partial [Streptomyces sp. NPDC087300]
PLRLARFGVPLAETAPAGLAAAGIEPVLLPPAPTPTAVTAEPAAQPQAQLTAGPTAPAEPHAFATERAAPQAVSRQEMAGPREQELDASPVEITEQWLFDLFVAYQGGDPQSQYPSWDELTETAALWHGVTIAEDMPPADLTAFARWHQAGLPGRPAAAPTTPVPAPAPAPAAEEHPFFGAPAPLPTPFTSPAPGLASASDTSPAPDTARAATSAQLPITGAAAAVAAVGPTGHGEAVGDAIRTAGAPATAGDPAASLPTAGQLALEAEPEAESSSVRTPQPADERVRAAVELLCGDPSLSGAAIARKLKLSERTGRRVAGRARAFIEEQQRAKYGPLQSVPAPR